MFLEDGDWRRANEYCEKVLDMYPECALAYLGKLMAEYHRHTSGALGELHEPFDKSNNYQKAIRFGDSKLKEELNTCLDQVIARKEHARQEDIYLDARDKMNAAQTEAEFKLAAQIFDTVPDFQDAPALAQQCRHMAEDARKDAIYNKAQSLVDTDQLPMYMQAIPLYESIPDWKDSTQQIDFCRRRIVEKEAEATNNAKHRKTVALIAAILAAIVASIVIVYNLHPTNPRAYNSAIMELGQTICTSGRPDCLLCPLRPWCQAEQPENLPVKLPKQEITTMEHHDIFLLTEAGLLLEKQAGNKRHAGMYRLPRRSAEHCATLPHLADQKYSITRYKVTRHLFRAAADEPLQPGEEFIPLFRLDDTPMASPDRKIIRQFLQ